MKKQEIKRIGISDISSGRERNISFPHIASTP